MHIKCWGTRGSIPRVMSHEAASRWLEELVALASQQNIHDLQGFLAAVQNGDLAHPLTHGGNSTCTQVGHGSHVFYIDMGSGFREAGYDALARGDHEHHIFITHMHWDHLIGMPFFASIYHSEHRLHIHHVHKDAPEFIRINFNGVNFPITWDQLHARIEFHQMTPHQSERFGEVLVTPFVLDHPGGAYGYRFDAGGGSIAIGVDSEYKRISREDLGDDLRIYQNLDLLLFDGQYENDESADRVDWGHSNPNAGVDLALREKVRTLVFSHHDPRSDDAKLRFMLKEAQAYMCGRLPDFADLWADQPEGPRLLMAYDGLQIEIGD